MFSSQQPSPNNPYTFQRASTAATRNLVAPGNTGDTTTTTHAHSQHPHTNHYERAAAAAAQAGAQPSTTAATASMQKQQSWKVSDLRGEKQGQVVEEKAGGQGHGYSSAK